MAKRYPRSSYNDEAMAKYDSDCRELLLGGITTGRSTFWLRGIVATNSHASNADVLVLWDDDTEGAEAAGPDAADRRLEVYCGPADTVSLDFAAPGLEFKVGVLAAVTNSPATGTFSTNSICITGYEE